MDDHPADPNSLTAGTKFGNAQQNPFVCNICKRTYTRIDHLGRHYRSHTNEKPFSCDKCRKSFARVDLLRRHRQNHVDGDTIAKPPTRARTGRACIGCADAKLRCSDSRPCERCVTKAVVCEPIRHRQTREAPNANETIPPGNENGLFEHDSSFVPFVDQFRGDSSNEEQLTMATQLTSAMEMALPPSDELERLTEDQSTIEYGRLGVQFDMSSAFNGFEGSDDIGLFLRDIMYSTGPIEAQAGETFGAFPDVLDFTLDDTSMPLRSMSCRSPIAMDLNVPPEIRESNLGPPAVSGTVTPTVQNTVNIGHQAFGESMWKFTPDKRHNRRGHQKHLTLPDEHSGTDAGIPDAPFPCRLSAASRDRILALVLRSCDRQLQRYVAARFPSADILSLMIEAFTAYHSHQVVNWIHLATLNLNGEYPEFLLSLVCSGAASSQDPDVRRFGYAMQETVRDAIAESFEEDNRHIRELRSLQAFALELSVGRWSGIRRQIEIAEGFAHPFITMLRRGANFRRKSGPTVEPSNDPTTNESSWKEWVHVESFKRLSYLAFYEDACISMSLFNPPLVSVAEVHLDMPCSRDLWQASSAEEWKKIYEQQSRASYQDIPSFRACLSDIRMLSKHQSLVDSQMCLILLVCAIWGKVWQWRQMKATSFTVGGDQNSLVASAYFQEVVSSCRILAVSASNFENGIGCHPKLMLELCQMHLHVSLDDIQLFAGKEGLDEARRSLSLLRTWVGLPESRQALHHAGQVLCCAAQYSFGTLGGFPSVAVYHASLTMWAYAVLTESLSRGQPSSGRGSLSSSESTIVWLDGGENQESLQRFIMLGIGSPCIRTYADDHTTNGHATSLANPMEVMNSIVGLLVGKHRDTRSPPLFVTKLSKLMLSLGKVANSKKFGIK
ncbi:hypothetical protein BKA64DRAFT_308256 [Cadophora sp. MPI-SDFR-AT-0126]|nr:hypothetical protein BKA64DRAFT_308256 [Leotiomycetes sp. MPI-SDFR-AT-0126]